MASSSASSSNTNKDKGKAKLEPIKDLWNRFTGKADEEASTSALSSSGLCGKYSKKYPLLWSIDAQRHYLGHYSFAVVRGNQIIEDFSQVDTFNRATFVGIYDGHGGTDAASHASHHLFPALVSQIQRTRRVNQETVGHAINVTEQGFRAVVNQRFEAEQLIATKGSCCLAGLFWADSLYVGHLGDSRVVRGFIDPVAGIFGQQLTMDHKTSNDQIRNDLEEAHRDQEDILVQVQPNVWSIKGLIQISKSIGDAYLKDPERAVDARFERFHPQFPITRAVLTADPSLLTHELEDSDRFFIFASAGLWDLIDHQAAVEFVHKHPPERIAKKLLKEALQRAAERAHRRYKDLKYVSENGRRSIHDDISVVVVFVDKRKLSQVFEESETCLRGYTGRVESSSFVGVRHTVMDDE